MRKPAQRPSKAPEGIPPGLDLLLPQPCLTSSSLPREIFRDSLAAVDIPRVMREKLTRSGSLLTAGDTTLDLAPYRSVCVVAIGKASVAMSRGLSKLLEPDILVSGILVAPQDSIASVAGFRAIAAGHPLPGRRQPDCGARDTRSACHRRRAHADLFPALRWWLSLGGIAARSSRHTGRPAEPVPLACKLRSAHR